MKVNTSIFRRYLVSVEEHYQQLPGVIWAIMFIKTFRRTLLRRIEKFGGMTDLSWSYVADLPRGFASYYLEKVMKRQ